MVTKDAKMSLLDKEFLEKNTPKFYQRPNFFLLLSKDKKTIWITSNYLYNSSMDLCIRAEDQEEDICFKEKYQHRFVTFFLENPMEENVYHISLKSFDEEKHWIKKTLGFSSVFYEKKDIYIGLDKNLFEEKKQKKLEEEKNKEKVILNKKQETQATLKFLLSSLTQDYKNIFETHSVVKARELFLSLYGKKYSPIFTQLLTSLESSKEYEGIIDLIQKIGFEVIQNYDNLKKDEKNKVKLKNHLLDFLKNTEKKLEEL